jgi:hypothetical protein
MTTARSLFLVVLDQTHGRAVSPGDLSLALAGAELVDLLGTGAAALHEDRVVPDPGAAPADALLAQAFAALRQEEPYEPVGDWLWRRGEGLADTYAGILEAEGALSARRRGRLFADGALTLADSVDRRRAVEAWSSADPVLVSLAEEVGITGASAPDPESLESLDDSVTLVLAAVGDALLELEGVRQRRTIEQAAFDNVWRGSN